MTARRAGSPSGVPRLPGLRWAGAGFRRSPARNDAIGWNIVCIPPAARSAGIAGRGNRSPGVSGSTSNLNLLAYDKQWRYYRIGLKQSDLEDEDRCNTISELIGMANAAYPSNK